jgi:predicted ATPase/two-component sensor histidine kinase
VTVDEFSGQQLEMLVEDGGLQLLRFREPDRPFSILLRTAVGRDLSTRDRGRLLREFQLASQLDPRWSVRPIELLERNGVPALSLSDPGGEPLSRLLDRPLELTQFFQISLGIAASLGHIHRDGVIHRDLRPANILVGEGARIWFTGFGLASTVPRERIQPLPFDMLPGSLQYMAPEQTGRMNRSVDHRADLYALGVAFYQMLTGRLPFVAAEAIEWVHSHIARAPLPMTGRTDELPAMVSEIVFKLLSKTVEDRYQTALGLESDLRRCFSAWEANGKIEGFALGSRDTSYHLLIPEKLYGREQQIDSLVRSFERVVSDGAMEIVLVSGSSGIGKSSLVNEIQKALVSPRGIFAGGKFDQYKRDVPYGTLTQALRELFTGILGQPAPVRDRWRSELRNALGANARLIVDLVPKLETLIGAQPDVVAVPGPDAARRFDATLASLLETLASADHPLTLFFDDLQWLDQATLSFLDRLIGDGGMPHLLLIGAYRDNEVGADHPLSVLIDSMRAGAVTLNDLRLGPMAASDIALMLADALSHSVEHVEALAAEVHRRTAGNPFHVVQFVTSLAEAGILKFDAEQQSWAWDPNAFHATPSGNTISDLVADRLAQSPAGTQHALSTLACLGNSASAATLEIASGITASSLEDIYWKVIREGLLLRTDGGYAFAHDRIQEAAYALLSVDARSQRHIEIGRGLLRAFGETSSNERIFDIVSQFDRGIDKVGDEEREQIARLHLTAAKRAKASGAHRSALDYLLSGSRLLRSDRWETQHPVAFETELERADAEFLTGDMQGAENRLLGLLTRVQSLKQRAAVTSLLVELYTARDEIHRAIETCLAHLKFVGIDWSPQPGPEQALTEYQLLFGRLNDGSLDGLEDLPLLTDEDVRATLDVLAAALPPAFFSDQHLVALILCRMANISIANGVGDASALAFAYLGMIVGPYFNDYPLAFRFGQLGLRLAESRNLNRYRTRILMVFAYHVSPWTRDMRETRALLITAHEEARGRGDVTYGGFTAVTLITSMIAAGDPLRDVERAATSGLAFVRSVKFGFCADILVGHLRLIRQLRGETPSFSSFDEPGFEEARFEERLVSTPGLELPACWYWIRKLQGRYFSGDYVAARAAAANAAPLIWTSAGHLEIAEFRFFAALANAAAHDGATESQRASLVEGIEEQQRHIEIWARNSPINFGCRADLVSAELARTQGRSDDAIMLYDRSVRAAQSAGLPHVEALAYELGASFYIGRGIQSVGEAYLSQARDAYARWGAAGKAAQLEDLHACLRESAVSSPAPAAGTVELGTMDLATVLKTSSAISGQTTLDELLTISLELMIEHAGATRGLLILVRGERLIIEAEAATAPKGITVHLGKSPPSKDVLPLTLMNAAVRDRTTVSLDDARSPGTLEDSYFRDGRARSVLVLPLLRQTKVVGILYLENELATHAFTPERVSVLKLLASQAAISLENASLEEKEALLKEVHHRVKNNLQLITSLLNLQAARISDPAVAALFDESRDRLRSMALVHENLYRLGNFAYVEMKAHLEGVCAHLFRAYAPQGGGVSLATDIDDIQLDLDQAMACSLIANELVSNALKHAFPDGRRGTVTISLQELDDRRCLLRVQDDGVGLDSPIDPESTETLGLQIVADLTSQIHGELVTRWIGGADIAISFRALMK